MWIVRLALRRPYTFVVMAVLIAILGGTAIVTMPVDIFPYIDIPIVSVVWPYNGLSPEEMEKRVVTNFERNLTSGVNDIEHIESQSYNGHRRCQGLLPSQRADRYGRGAGHRADAKLAAQYAARHVSRQRPEVRRRQRADSAAWGSPARPCANRRSSIWARTSSAFRSPPCRARPFPIRLAGKTASVMVDLNLDRAVRQATCRPSTYRTP